METMNVLYANTDLKFKITSLKQDLVLSDGDFKVIIKNKWGQTKFEIEKDKCFFDSDGNYYFTLEKVPSGVFNAFFYGQYEDEDYVKGFRVITDVQYLCTVVGDSSSRKCACMASPKPFDCVTDAHCVKYEQVWVVSVDGGDYLADSEGNYIYTSDGKRIQFTNNNSQNVENMGKVKLNMTGDEFKQLVEGEKPNGEIDTIPEMKKALEGIPDTETVKQDVDEQIDEGLQQKMATQADIDEIFNK